MMRDIIIPLLISMRIILTKWKAWLILNEGINQ
jgi:hypothetical protein